MLDEWKGKRVLITGASRGSVRRLLNNWACWALMWRCTITAVKRPPKRWPRPFVMPVEAFTLKADVSHSNEARRLVDEAAERLGGLDLLINNAGDMLGRVGLDAMDDDQYDRVMDLNVRSVIMASRAALPHFRRGEAAILFTPPQSPHATVGSRVDYTPRQRLCEYGDTQYGQRIGGR